jgi:hypothetical protein
VNVPISVPPVVSFSALFIPLNHEIPSRISACLGILALIATGCAHQSLHQRSEASTPDRKHPIKVIELPRQTLIFKPTRDDITVGCVILSLYVSNLDAVHLEAIRVNGGQPEIPVLFLKQVGKNRFELPALKIEFSSKELGGPLYMSIKAWFNELTNQGDSFYYENLPDRYALLSYCTKEDDDPSKVNARMGANRVATVKEFKERLARPFVIKLNQRPLREEWGRYPMINNQARQLTEPDLKEVQKLVRDRGEQFVRAISVVDSDHARVAVGDGTFFRDARIYKVVRSDGTWRVESVESINGHSW